LLGCQQQSAVTKRVRNLFDPKTVVPDARKTDGVTLCCLNEKKINVLSRLTGPPKATPACVWVSPGSGSPAKALVAETWRFRRSPKTLPSTGLNPPSRQC